MYIYILFFIVSLLCIYMGKKYEKMKWLSISLEILSIVLLSFLAAIRDNSIGTDINVYVKPIFDFFVEYGNSSFKVELYNDIEIGYRLFNYIISIFTNNLPVLLFFIQLFILTFSFLGIKKMYPKNYPLVYSIFILIFYNRSLNLVRQSMALVLCIYALPYLFEKKYKKFFIIVIAASLFHKSALIFLTLWIIYMIIKNKNINQYLIATGIFSFGIILFIFFPQLINIFINLHLLPSKYEFYLSHYVLNEIDFNCLEIGINIFLMCIYVVFAKIYNNKEEKSKFYFVLLTINLMCLIIASRYVSAYRMSIYFSVPVLLYFLSNLNLVWKKEEEKKFNLNLIGIGIAIVFWFWIYAYGNSGQTVPFISIFK